MITRVRSIGIKVSDQARAVAFYRDTVGLELRSDVPMGDQARWIELAAPGDDTVVIPYNWQVPDHSGTYTGIVFECDDIDATYTQLHERGVEFLGPPTRQAWGTFTTFRDPDGNLSVLVSRLVPGGQKQRSEEAGA
jgi:predicted enzyme related to lactoylglutathione lyase